MDKSQAHKLLTEATNQLRLTRDEHVAVQQALNVLKPEEKIEEKEETQS